MKVNYTLPGVLPELELTAPAEVEELPAESFSAHLQRLRAPERTDWRALLRLNITPAGGADIGPPLAPHGLDLRDGTSQRAWWRATLAKHTRLLENTSQEGAAGMGASSLVSVQRMLGLLLESQGLEDEVFARHFTESGN
jgi:hypothetical protein